MKRKSWLVTKMPVDAVKVVKQHKKQHRFKYLADALADLIQRGSK